MSEIDDRMEAQAAMAELDELRRWQRQQVGVSLDDALNFAAQHLPDGYEIEFGCEKDAAWAKGIDPDGKVFSEDADVNVSEGGWGPVIEELVNEARELAGETPVHFATNH